MPAATSREQFDADLAAAVEKLELEKLTLGKYRGTDDTLKKLLVRPLQLKSGPHLSFVWRHKTQDITKNHPVAEGLTLLKGLIGSDFRDAHVFTRDLTLQLETADDGKVRVRRKTKPSSSKTQPAQHNRQKHRFIDPRAGWLHTLGITNSAGMPQKGQTAKFRQIEKFAEILAHRWSEAGWTALDQPAADPTVHVADMGSGKGYLTFAMAALLEKRAEVVGVEQRIGLVDTCNHVATSQGITNLRFQSGDIATAAKALKQIDVLVALHACDTATDDALAAGIAANARLLVVAPCCQKQLRPQLKAPAKLKAALRHGIFQERHAEFVTDALRALLLEAWGFETKVFEFISSEHTAKNTMITATRTRSRATEPSPRRLEAVREFARLYSIKEHALATQLGVALA
ncbi:MAG: SAM-dependent methyltransferase [Synoicihabitans sp.]